MEEKELTIEEIHQFTLSNEEEYTQREIAALLGISRSYVSRIEKSAIEKLREYF